ncbi:hypothetical protein Tco_0628568 [Tanacetum coccineum]|uniref:Uncharacterized protein n=1 Tax=Tanacetum coccineum TaxID=301880 RepID=A0ABQ4WQQ2_9ASTR
MSSTPLPQLKTPTPTPTTVLTTTLIPALPDFYSLFSFDQRVSTLETELSQLKQTDPAQLLESVKSQLPTMVDDLLSTRIRYATRTTLESYTKDFEKKSQEERKLYIDIVEKSVKDIIKDESTITKSLENIVLAKSSSQSQSTYEAAASLTEFELKKILIDKLEKSKSYRAFEEHRNLYDALIKSYQLDKDLFDSYAYVMHNLKIDNLTQEILCYKVVTDQLDWNNPEGHEYPFDLSKPLSLIEAQCRQVVPADYFFNNDLEYLKGIKDMVLELWSPVKVAYDKYAMWGISHYGPKRQKFYGYASNKESKHDVFSKKRIIAVTHVKAKKWYGYGYLEEIIIRQEDQSLHKFKEGEFPRLNLRDIEDLLLLLV